MAAGALKSDHVNYLIWRYLQESGHGEAAVKFQSNWGVQDPQTLPFASRIKTHALVSLIQKGLQYHQVEQSLSNQSAAREAISAATLYFGANSARPSSSPNEDQIEDDNSPRARKHVRESNANGLGLEFATPAPKRSRRSNGTEVSTNGDHQMGDSTQLDRNGYGFHQEPPEPVSPTDYSPEEDGQTNGMDIDNDVDAPGSLTPEDQMILTLTNGQSIGVQSDKVAELGPQTIILTVPDKSHVMHTAWNPKDPTILAVAGEALCRLWYISRTASFTDNPNHKSYVDILDPAYDSYVSTMAWNPSGDTLAVATRDDSSDWIGAVSLWSKMGKAEDELPAAQDMVLKLRWSPSGNQLLGITISGGASSSSILLWDRNSSPVAPYQLPNILTDAAWTSNNQVTVCGDGIIASSLLEDGRIVTLNTRSEAEARHNWMHLRYDSRTHTTALAAEDSGILGLIDSSDTLRTVTAHDAEITALAFQPVTNLSAYPASAPRLLATSSLDGSIIIWDAKRPFTIVHRLNLGYQAPAMDMSFTPDGFLVAVANESKVLIWNPEAGGVPKASWKGDLKKLTNGLLTNGDGVDAMEEDGAEGEQNCSLSWDAEGKKLTLGVESSIAIINFRP